MCELNAVVENVVQCSILFYKVGFVFFFVAVFVTFHPEFGKCPPR